MLASDVGEEFVLFSSRCCYMRILFFHNIVMAQMFNVYLQPGESTLGQIGQGAYAVIYSIQQPNGSTVARKIAEDKKGLKAIEKELKILRSPGVNSVPIVKLMVCLFFILHLFLHKLSGSTNVSASTCRETTWHTIRRAGTIWSFVQEDVYGK